MGKPMSDQANEILTIDEVAAYLKAGTLGGTWRFRRGYLDEWIASRIGKVMVDDGEDAE